MGNYNWEISELENTVETRNRITQWERTSKRVLAVQNDILRWKWDLVLETENSAGEGEQCWKIESCVEKWEGC